MALPGDQDGKRLVAAGAIVIPAGCVVKEIECQPDAADATVDLSQFEPSIGGTIAVPVGLLFEEKGQGYVGDGVKSIVFGGSVKLARVAWAVL